MHAPGQLRSRAKQAPFLPVMHDLASGTLVGSLAITYSYTFAALIYSGALTPGLRMGLAAAFLGAGITSLIVSFGSSIDRALGGLDTPVIAVVSVLAATIAQQMAGSANTDTLLATVQGAIIIATVATGVTLLALGMVRGGSWLRFIPYSVSAGFLGASGLFLVVGALKVTTGGNIDLLRSWPTLTPQDEAQALAAFSMAALLFATRIFKSPFVLPASLFAVAILANVVTHMLSGTTAPEVLAAWYLHGNAGDGGITPLWDIAFSKDIAWGVVADHASGALAVAGVAVLAVLLNVSGLEVVRHLNADLDQEFRVSGYANLAAALFGGLPGNLSMNRSYLNVRAGARTRLSGLVISAICFVFLLWGNELAPYIPRFVLGGLLIFLGITILGESVLRPVAQLSRADRLLALTIMIVVVKFGYAVATAFGVVAACAIFAVSYSRIDVVKQKFSRKTYPSRVTRGPLQTKLLLEKGDAIQILRLHGYIFFGTAHRLLTRIRELTARHEDIPVRFVILDLGMVPEFDSSAVLSFRKMRSFCESVGVALVFSNIAPAMHERLNAAAQLGAADGQLRVFTERDEALEWCEDVLLADSGADTERPFLEWLEEEVGGRDVVERLLTYLEKCDYAKGDVVFKQDDAANSVEFIASGRLRIEFEQEDGRRVYLRSMTNNTVVGEMGFFRDMTRTASVIAEQPATVYRLERAKFLEMFAKDPQANSTLNALIVRVLSDRLAEANHEISAFS